MGKIRPVILAEESLQDWASLKQNTINFALEKQKFSVILSSASFWKIEQSKGFIQTSNDTKKNISD